MKQRILAILLSLTMIFTLVPTAMADATGTGGTTPQGTENEDAIPNVGGAVDLYLSNGAIIISATGYQQGDGTEIAHTGPYTISQTGSDAVQNTITVTGGDQQITLNGVNIDLSKQTEGIPCAFAIEGGNVTVALADGTENTLKSGLIDSGTTGISCAGLWVGQNASLTITGNSGKLIAVGGGTGFHNFGNAAKAAGIGASRVYGSGYDTKYNTVGDITIAGGVINATGSKASGYYGPGIGGGSNASNITISDGIITAESGSLSGSLSSGCAAIGSAYGHSGKKHIVISGGTVKATGGSAGIGGGAYASADVTITGGNVTAESYDSGAGIGGGGGAWSEKAVGSDGSVTITGGTVNASGSRYGAGIGGGGVNTQSGNDSGAQASGSITISGGIVTATGGQYAPGIGSGAVLNHNGKTVNVLSGRMGTIVISGGSVTATNGSNFADGGKSYKALDDAGVANVNTGIGQGVNASEDSQTAFEAWAPTDSEGNAILAVKSFSGSSVTYTRNGGSPVTVAGTDGTTVYLPEGYYAFNNDTENRVLIATAVDKTAAEKLITNLNSTNINDSDVVTKVTNAEFAYNALSASLQYYVDETVTSGHTLAALKNALESRTDIAVQVTLNANNGSVATTKPVNYGQPADFGKPNRTNYRFVGWYLENGEQVTDAEGKVSKWPYLSATTLEAKWDSEIEGSGKSNDPYIIKSGANLVALSHISLYGWDSVNRKNIYAGTEEEFALFGKDGVSEANRAALMKAYYVLGNDISLTTADKFYGIMGFTGQFDGRKHNIDLSIDTSGIVEQSEENGAGEEVELGKSSKRGKLKLTVGGSTVYIEINTGIFNSATGATIENFTTSGNVKILTNSAFTAVIVGTANGCTIKSITNEASLELGATDNTSWAAGIVGTVRGTSSTFENCHNTGAIKAGTFSASVGNSSAAGICSYQQSPTTYTSCSNSGSLLATRLTEVSGRHSNVGGIVGLATGTGTTTFTNCENTGNMSSQAETSNAAAGLIVVNSSDVGVVLNSCSNSAEISAKLGYAGALVSCKSGLSGMPTSATYTDCVHIMSGANASGYKVGNVAAAAGESGNFTIRVPVESNADNFYSADRYVIDGSGAKVADIASANYHYIYNDFTHNDNILEKNYPFQTEETAYVISSTEDYTNLVMAIRGDSAAQNAVLGNLFAGHDTEAKALALSNIYVKLNNNITLSDLNAIGIGTDEHPFGGTILGQNHTVTYALSNDALSAEQSSKVGFIGVSNGATVQDLSFAGNVNVQIDPENGNNVYFGAAVVDGSGATVKNCHSKVNYTVSRTTTVKNATGGFLKAGGLLGAQASATVEDSTYKGTIAVTSPKFARAGGIAAEIGGTVKNCKVEGDLSATLEYDAALPVYGEDSHAGGIAGVITSASTIENCMAVGSVSAKNTVNSDVVSGAYRYACAGGLIGNNTAAVTVKDCMALTTETADASMGASYQCAGAFAGKEDTALTLSGTNWYVKTTTVSVSDEAVEAIDTTVLNDSKTFGDTATMEVPEGVTMVSDYASLAGSTVSFIKAGDGGEVKLVYNGHTFYTAAVNVAPKSLTDGNVTVTGVNDKYSSDSAAAKATLNVIHNGKELVKDTDYTVTQDTTNHKFTITFNGNYSGSVERNYSVVSDILEVTALDYTGTYDGKNHSITVNAPEGATVKYGESAGTCNQNSVVKKDAGTYVVYWKATKDNQTVSGSAVINIAKAPLTIKADNQYMYVGDTKPTKFTYTVSGLVNGEALTTEPTLSCATDGQTVGTFAIVPSGASVSGNYEIRYINGSLTVSQRYITPSIPATPAPKPDYTSNFADVPANAFFADAVKWAVDKGVTNGLTDTMFGPYEPCTRGLIITFLWRAAGSPEPKTAVSFTDVPAGSYYAKAVAWAIENGITNGVTETTFAPDATCTRGQSVTFLYRALKGSAGAASSFVDVPTNAFYADAVGWAVSGKVTDGTSNTTFSPDDNCTRGQIVTFLYRAYQGK